MLVNGAKLGYKKTRDGATYTDLPGLKEIPDWGSDPEKVENTSVTAKYKEYEMGIGDLGEVKYKFKYDNTAAASPYRVLRGLSESGDTAFFQEKLKDGTVTEFSAQVALKRTGGTVNGVLECEATMVLQSAPTITDPA